MRASGKRPTRRQKMIMAKWRLQPDNWLVVKDLPHGEMHVIHRVSGKERIIKGRGLA